MCIFQVTWISGPNVGKHVQVNFASIYLLEFRNIENQAILKGVEFLENHLVRPQKRLHKIIVEDENGFIIIKEVITEHLHAKSNLMTLIFDKLILIQWLFLACDPSCNYTLFMGSYVLMDSIYIFLAHCWLDYIISIRFSTIILLIKVDLCHFYS